ncbi:Hypothetical protein, putative [Bodo saltans]|uniref:Ribosome biogenesis protein SLX9 n=1 Tax=Bodo saltans TaxID=75058 RepID=A0A0S4JDQ4_BODSA|nr:Hypothetical protein, putative [Bodo saltans]|eukprot:CUG89484.1 Hypothetical protein, putative [Bodo saltans]
MSFICPLLKVSRIKINMGKPVNKVSRKLSKKMGRVVGGSADDQNNNASHDAQPSSSGVPAQAVPAEIPTEVHLQTRRERLLKKIFAKKSTEKEGGAKKKRVERNTESTTVVSKDQTERAASKSNSKRRELAEAVGRQVIAKVAQEQPMQVKTSLNMKSGVRHDMFVRELNLFHNVTQNAAFVEDPFGAIQQHLDSTMKKLVPQTADVGRRPKPAPGSFESRQQQFRQNRYTARH